MNIESMAISGAPNGLWRALEGEGLGLGCEYARNIDPTPEAAQGIDIKMKMQNGVGSCFARNVTPSKKRIHLHNQ